MKRNSHYNVPMNMNVNARLSRSNLNLNQKQTPHFHRSYHNLNGIEQQYPPPPPRPSVAATTTTTILIQPQYHEQHQQQQQINNPYVVTQYVTPAGKIYQEQQQNQWFRNNANNNTQRSINNNNINNSNWTKYNAYETPNFVPASFWMNAERFVHPSVESNSSTTWQPQEEQEEQPQQQQAIQRGNILDYKNQSNTIYNVYNHNLKRHKTTGNSSNGVPTTIQPVIKVRTNVQGLPYTPQPERRNTVNEQRAIQAVMPLNDTLIYKRHQTS